MNWCFFLFVWCVFEMIKRRLMPVTHRNNWSFWSRWTNWKQMKIASQKRKKSMTKLLLLQQMNWNSNWTIFMNDQQSVGGVGRRRKKIMRARKEKKNFFNLFLFFFSIELNWKMKVHLLFEKLMPSRKFINDFSIRIDWKKETIGKRYYGWHT